MNLHDIILKQYQAGFAEVADAPVTRRHYIDTHPTGNRFTFNFANDTPKTAATKKRIVEFLKENPGLTSREIAEGLDLTMTALLKKTSTMVDAGILEYEIGVPQKTGGRRKYKYFVAESV